MSAARLSSKAQAVIAVLLALALGWVYQISVQGEIPGTLPTDSPTEIVLVTNTIVSSLVPANTPTIDLTPRPFVTLPGAWYVSIRFYKNQNPEVNKVLYLKEGRLSLPVAGESRIMILDINGENLFDFPFHLDFRSGEPPVEKEEINQAWVLPVIEGAVSLIIETPQGTTLYVLPNPTSR